MYNLYKYIFKNDHLKLGLFAIIIFEKYFKGVNMKWPMCSQSFAPVRLTELKLGDRSKVLKDYVIVFLFYLLQSEKCI